MSTFSSFKRLLLSLNFNSPPTHLFSSHLLIMARDIISRYIWLVDTIMRYGKLTRAQINRQWLRSAHSDGKELAERTFFHYRRAIEENFHIEIKCNGFGEYYIDPDTDSSNRVLTNWLLDSYVVNNAMKDSPCAAERISVEDVPSARRFLPLVLEAIGNCEKISFTYAGFTRSRPETDILFRPYFVKRYKQRWYMIGLKEKSDDIRTYALDRVQEMQLLNRNFTMPEDITPDDVFANIIGITESKAPARTIRLKTNPTQAKYFRALPFHTSQTEEIHDSYSIFNFRLKINYELVHEILSLGNNVEVLEPKELRLMVENELRAALALYDSSISPSSMIL